MDSDYYCCHGEDVSRCLVTLRIDGKHTHACVTHNASQTACVAKTTTQVCGFCTLCECICLFSSVFRHVHLSVCVF